MAVTESPCPIPLPRQGNYDIEIRHPAHHFIHRMYKCDVIIEQTLRVFVLVCAEILINYLNG